MIKKLLILIILFCPFISAFSWDAGQINMQTYYHPMRTKEEFYSMYRENMYHKVENINANITWLEYAKKAPFDHPVKALAKITSEAEWKQYQKLFLFQMNFLIMKSYISLAEQYDKPNILFFNPPYAKELQEGFQMAQIYYKRAALALQEAQKLADMAWETRDNTPHSLDGELDKWANMVYKIKNTDYYHEVNYNQEINNRLIKVDKQISKLEAISKS